jgi:hypothetical protein
MKMAMPHHYWLQQVEQEVCLPTDGEVCRGKLLICCCVATLVAHLIQYFWAGLILLSPLGFCQMSAGVSQRLQKIKSVNDDSLVKKAAASGWSGRYRVLFTCAPAFFSLMLRLGTII